jgi:transcriptional regulator with XRE-family HTH domain
VRRLRTDAGLTQDELARAIAEEGGVAKDRSRLARMENEQRHVRLGEAVLIARVLGSTVDEMLR